MDVLNAVAMRCASITRWLPRLPWLQLSGTMKQMMQHLMMWWHNASKSLVGTALSVAANGVHHLTAASGREIRAAVRTVLKENRRPTIGTQPLQSASTLSWQSGTINVTQLKGTLLPTQSWEAARKFSGSVTSAQQGKSTGGLQNHIIELAASRQAVHSVLGRLLADATPCRRCTLT